jgi:hypothetical protein
LIRYDGAAEIGRRLPIASLPWSPFAFREPTDDLASAVGRKDLVGPPAGM